MSINRSATVSSKRKKKTKHQKKQNNKKKTKKTKTKKQQQKNKKKKNNNKKKKNFIRNFWHCFQYLAGSCFSFTKCMIMYSRAIYILLMRFIKVSPYLWRNYTLWIHLMLQFVNISQCRGKPHMNRKHCDLCPILWPLVCYSVFGPSDATVS